MVHLHKTARAIIPYNLLLMHKMCLLESRHFQVFQTVFILKFGPPVARIIKFEF